MLGVGVTKIDRETHDWDEDDKHALFDYAMHPRTTNIEIVTYLRERGVCVAPDTAWKWRNKQREETAEVKKMRMVFAAYKDIQAHEIVSYIAGITTELVVTFAEKLKTADNSVTSKDIAAFATLAKEARVAAMSVESPNSPQSMKELEGSLAVSFSDKLDKIFAEDDVMRERVKSACKAAMIDIEAQY